MFFKTCYSNTERILHKIWRKSTEKSSHRWQKEREREVHVSQRASLQPPDSQEALASPNHSPPGTSAIPHSNRGRGQPASEEGKSVNCQLSWMKIPHLHDPFHEFPSWGQLPKNQCSAGRWRPTTTHEKNEGQIAVISPKQQSSHCHTRPRSTTRGPEEGRGRLRGRHSLTVRSRGSTGPAQPWEQT